MIVSGQQKALSSRPGNPESLRSRKAVDNEGVQTKPGGKNGHLWTGHLAVIFPQIHMHRKRQEGDFITDIYSQGGRDNSNETWRLGNWEADGKW